MLRLMMLGFGCIVIGNLVPDGNFWAALCLWIMWAYSLYRE